MGWVSLPVSRVGVTRSRTLRPYDPDMTVRPTLLVLPAVILLIAGPSVITFTSLEERGVIGWGLITLGVVLLVAGAARRSKSQ